MSVIDELRNKPQEPAPTLEPIDYLLNEYNAKKIKKKGLSFYQYYKIRLLEGFGEDVLDRVDKVIEQLEIIAEKEEEYEEEESK